MAEQEFTTEELETEEWRPVSIERYCDLYSVSNLGRVRSERTAKILKPARTKQGYLYVGLHRDKIVVYPYVHVLVAASFIGPRPNGYEVNHCYGVKSNCRARDLEYLTNAQNRAHAVRFGLMARGDKNGARKNPEAMRRGSEQGCAKLTEVDIPVIRKLLDQKVSQAKIATRFGVSQVTISHIKLRQIWLHVPG